MSIVKISVFLVAMVLTGANIQAATPAEMAADAVKQAADAAKKADEAVTAAKAAVTKATLALEEATKGGSAESIAQAKNNLAVLQDMQKGLEKLSKGINAELAIAKEAQGAIGEAGTPAVNMALAEKAQKAAAKALKLLDGVASRKAIVDQYLKDGTLPMISFGRARIPDTLPTTSTTMARTEDVPMQPPTRVNPTPVGGT